MSNYTSQQLARISELDGAIDKAADQGDEMFFAAVAAKDEYIDEQGIDRDRLEVTGREVQENVGNETQKPTSTVVEYVSVWDEGTVTTHAVLDLRTGAVTDIEASDDGQDYEHLQYEEIRDVSRGVSAIVAPDEKGRYFLKDLSMLTQFGGTDIENQERNLSKEKQANALHCGEYKIRVPLKALLDDTQVKTLVAALQRSYDDGTAGGFDITSTGPVSEVTFYREMGDDLDVIQDNIARNALKSREPEAVVVEQLAYELAEHQDESPTVQEIVATMIERGAALLVEGDRAMVREEIGSVLKS